ncbi:MAG TPA: hypothetical protein VHW71_10535 [Steroidobacteraceae bacterium]|jgi:hypothetical protein|nr:hypothetical protein [Steroidobacteraceae bacterium]
MNGIQESLARSPQMFPHLLDPPSDSVSFVDLTRADYEKASFLDGRILTPQTPIRTLPWRDVAAAVESAGLAEHCGLIFHIGHVGSTLLSRLIGAHPGAFALREPGVLRAFAQIMSEPAGMPAAWSGDDIERRLSSMLKLFSRTFDGRQLAVIKATSFVSELAAALLARASRPRAVLMYVSPESYLATILGGPNSREEAKILAPSRLRRLHQRLGREAWSAASLSEGERLALAWVCEMSGLAAAAGSAGERAARLDFDEFLADPSTLLGILRHLGIDANAAEVSTILDGPDMRRYSKAPEYAYDRALRVAVLNQARELHGHEIRRGLVWLDRAAEQFAPVRQAIALAASPTQYP